MNEFKTYFRCAEHPDRMGFVDLGIENAENRYPCKDCYAKIVLKRKLLLKEKKEKRK
ncbi:MAG: hypothetical protein PHY02_11085 [Phycisphaerae bacterium]|nr:hypothetical protein [Phycisphaerae bacterium]